MIVTESKINNLIYHVNGAAIEVHKTLGPGLLESVYHKCLLEELRYREIFTISELKIPIIYKKIEIEVDLRCDFFVGHILPVEIKAVDYILPIHEAQIMTYMKLLKVPKGLLINFNVTHIFKEGQRTFVNERYRDLPE